MIDYGVSFATLPNAMTYVDTDTIFKNGFD
jgi:hypothetical protein